MAKIVVAIDLGTSRSAWAFSMKDRAEEEVIVRIPKGSLASASAGLKTETAILLDTETENVRAFGRAAREKFVELKEREEWILQEGSDARGAVPASEAMLFRWFKIALCEKRGYQSIHDISCVAEDGQNKPLFKVISSTLRHFKEDILAYLSSTSGVHIGVGDIIWVLTIPAIYDDFAKNFMRHAAHAAGIISTVGSSQLQLCLEPEAACLAVNMKEEALRLCSSGSTIMIVDCGGGTVDITTHEILSSKPLRLKEVMPPTGGKWGSTCVDNAFKDWFRGFLGASNFDQVVYSIAFLSLMQQWEDAKVNFGGNSDETVRLNVGEVARIIGIDGERMKELRKSYNDSRGSPASHVGGGKFMIVLPSRVVNSFFSASIERIGTCLEALKNNDAIRTLSHVVLVGGFSSSPLIASTVKERLHRDGCAVITALRPDVAIVRGAVLFANNTAVFHTRKARLTYGVKTFRRYNKNDPGHVKHFAKHKGGPGEDGKPTIAVFSRHLVVGDDVSEDGGCQPQSYGPLRSTHSEVFFEILASHLRDVRFPNEDECFKLGEVTVPLDMSVPFASRSVLVQFNFGGTEFSVTGVDKATGKKRQVTLNMIQEAEVCS
ncbi:unnamed protein product [Ascophyllum nodosum]